MDRSRLKKTSIGSGGIRTDNGGSIYDRSALKKTSNTGSSFVKDRPGNVGTGGSGSGSGNPLKKSTPDKLPDTTWKICDGKSNGNEGALSSPSRKTTKGKVSAGSLKSNKSSTPPGSPKGKVKAGYLKNNKTSSPPSSPSRKSKGKSGLKKAEALTSSPSRKPKAAVTSTSSTSKAKITSEKPVGKINAASWNKSVAATKTKTTKESVGISPSKSYDVGSLTKKLPTNYSKASGKESEKESWDRDKLKDTGRGNRTGGKLLDATTADKAMLDDDQNHNLWLKGVLAKTNNDKNLEKKVMEYVNRIQAAGGMPKMRRLSVRDNDLVTNLTRAIANDPTLTEIIIRKDERFTHLSPSLVVEFAEALRANLHLKTLVITQVELGNDFLAALAASMEANFTLETVDLSDNQFTSDALVDFCLAMAENESLRNVNLSKQKCHIFKSREFVAIEALTKNKYVQEFKVEFQSKDCSKILSKVIKKNGKNSKSSDDCSDKLLDYLSKEAKRAEQMAAERKQAEQAQEVQEGDWPYLYKLHELATQFKLPYELESESTRETTEAQKVSDDPENPRNMPLNADGSFLNDDYITEFLEEHPNEKRLTFEYNNHCRVFRRFEIADPARSLIVKKFVDVLVEHPRAKEITHLHMSNTILGNDWLKYFCERCIKDPKLLPNLHLINLETNVISGPGVISIAKCIGNADTWIYLQAVKLDNQRQLLSSEAEDELARALCVNRSVIRLSMRVRNLYERRRIGIYIQRNMDLLRQARRWHGIKTGTLKERDRNEIEVFFDQIASNDPKITEVELISHPIFLSMDPVEVVKAAESFSKNEHVKKVKMSGLKLDDKFGIALGKSLETNTSIEVLDLESNAIGSEGLSAVISSLSKNRSITELLLRHQSKPMASTDEELLPGFIKDNDFIIKLSIDIRSLGARNNVEKKIRANQDAKRKKAAASKPADSTPQKRNRIEKLFDQVAGNDPKVTAIEIVSDLVFTSLRPAELQKVAESFANNTHVSTIKFSGLKLDDKFATTLSKTLETNKTVVKLDLESNSIGGDGIKALIEVLSTNNTITELLLRHQSKPMSSSHEEQIPSFVDNNTTIVKLSIDMRSMGPKNKLDKKLRQNQELKRKAALKK